MLPTCVCSSPASARIRVTTTVLENAIATAKMIDEYQSHPKRQAEVSPNVKVIAHWNTAPGTHRLRTRHSSLTSKWSPTPNISRMTPNSANSLAMSALASYPGVLGPTTIPAIKYPTIGESPRRCVAYPNTSATPRPAAMVINKSASCISIRRKGSQPSCSFTRHRLPNVRLADTPSDAGRTERSVHCTTASGWSECC
jgi:hypothetical protein